LADLNPMDTKLLAYLADSLHTSHSFNTHLGFEFRQVCVALLSFTYGLPVSFDSVQRKHMSQIRGQIQINATLNSINFSTFDRLIYYKKNFIQKKLKNFLF
jgi:hypothetical protein